MGKVTTIACDACEKEGREVAEEIKKKVIGKLLDIEDWGLFVKNIDHILNKRYGKGENE